MKRPSWQTLDSVCKNYVKDYKKNYAKGSMKIDTASPLHEFLRSNEWQHLHLAAMFLPQQHELAKIQKQFCILRQQNKKTLLYQSQDGQIQGLLLWTKHMRLLFDCLALRQAAEARLPYLLTQQLECALQKYPPHQFIGTKLHYDFLLHHSDLQFEERFYLMMVRNKIPKGTKPAKILGQGLRLERLGFAHFKDLLPLELAYYVEEVLLAPASRQMQKVLEQECAKRLEQYLQYGIFAGKDLIARIMINSYGLHYWQIGGIYTDPCWRGQGLATYLLHKVCTLIENLGRTAMLFVREHNPAAQSLYQKNGFEALDRMVIAQDCF